MGNLTTKETIDAGHRIKKRRRSRRQWMWTRNDKGVIEEKDAEENPDEWKGGSTGAVRKNAVTTNVKKEE